MKRWNRIFGEFELVASDRFDYFIDEGNTIYYKEKNTENELKVWCPEINLRKHLHHLWILTKGSTVINHYYLKRTEKNW